MASNQAGESVKLRLKIANAEIDYEGNETFLKDHVFKVFENALNHRNESLEVEEPTSDDLSESVNQHLAVNSIASILNVDTGPDLIIAAAAHLVFVQGKASFTRSDLRNEIKNATSFFKASYLINLSSYLGNLIKSGQLHEIGHDKYAMPEGKQNALKAQLDEHR